MDCLEALLQRITVNAHSSIRIETGGKVLYLDPFAIQTEPHDADVIFLTHDHFDHFSPQDIAKLNQPKTVFVIPRSSKAAAAEPLQGHQVLTVGPKESGTVEGVAFETVPAYNPCKPFHPPGEWLGRLCAAGGGSAGLRGRGHRCH